MGYNFWDAVAMHLARSCDGKYSSSAVQKRMLAHEHKLWLKWRVAEIQHASSELQRYKGMLGAQQEQTAEVVRVKREREAASEAAAAKVDGELRARAAELAELRRTAAARGMELEELRGKVREAEEQLECSICMERAVSTVFHPCGHCYCVDCASAADSCYTCLQPVAGKARLFLG